ncbi:hypothetical protein [Haloferax profundi]|uniref:hypothetical protein n=1 Tax=Haloferax profundi TaxID=1544718 RepID=UPI0012FA902F|nr:hypothetical protein [Haloferax profundi]
MGHVVAERLEEDYEHVTFVDEHQSAVERASQSGIDTQSAEFERQTEVPDGEFDVPIDCGTRAGPEVTGRPTRLQCRIRVMSRNCDRPFDCKPVGSPTDSGKGFAWLS